MKLSVLFSLVLALASPYAYAEPDCGDYLSELKKMPNNLEYISCTKVNSGQAHLKAEYRVRGTQAAAVEAYLVKVFNMKKLRFMCCGWEPEGGRTGQYNRVVNNVDYSYSITMHATSLEKNWLKIPYFYVTVTLYPGTI